MTMHASTTEELKQRASEAFAKGKFDRAAELYTTYCVQAPKDVQSRLRMGDAWSKAGEAKKAIAAYGSAAEAFAKDGFLPRAIAASKLILELDPAHQGVQKMLADLYAQKGAASRLGRPASPTPDPTPAPAPDAALEGEAVSDEDIEGVELTLPETFPLESEEALQESLEGPREEMLLAASPDSALELELDVELAPESVQVELASATPPGLSVKAEPAILLFGTRPLDLESPVVALTHKKAPSELGSSLPAFSRFDELELSPAEPLILPAKRVPSPFTELELGPDSLLELVELAAGLVEVDEPARTAADSGAPGSLPEIPLFSDLPPEAFLALLEHCPLRRYAKGERVIEQGSLGNAFYVICEGSVRVFREEAKQPRHLALLQHGAFFGEMALLSGAVRTASVESMSDETQLLEIGAAVLAPLAKAHPSVAKALRKFCRQRLLANVMDTSPLFRPFSRAERRELVERFRARDVRSGEVLVKEGEPSEGLFVILTGEAAVTAHGNRVATLREGELFGEMSLLTKTPATATVTAMRRTSLLRLPREDFDSLISSHPQILMLVAELTEHRQRLNALPMAADADEPLVRV